MLIQADKSNPVGSKMKLSALHPDFVVCEKAHMASFESELDRMATAKSAVPQINYTILKRVHFNNENGRIECQLHQILYIFK